MSPFRRSASSLPQRRPHPDARVEAELQRIISLRRAIARKEAGLGQIQVIVGQLRNEARRNPNTGTTVGGGGRLDQIEGYQRETQELEAEVTKLHDDIAARVSALTDTDLAYLDHH